MDFIPIQTLGISSPTHFTKQEITAKCGSSWYQVSCASIQRHLPVDIIGITPVIKKAQLQPLEGHAKAQHV